ncbi:MAG: flagellar biosynthetic protein FliO [Geobacteraceae bacterium]|nr:flagellar biosynthetic protein FliO [Geobacteraceae bacterium]
MRFLPLPFFLFAPCIAYGTELQGELSGFSVAGSLLQMMASLGIVVGVIFIARHLVGRIQKGGLGKGAQPRYLRVVETRFLGPKKSLVLVEAGGEYLLLGSTSDGISLIKQIDMVENIEVIEDLSPSARPANPLWEAARSLAGCIGRRGFRCAALERRAG